MNEFYDAIMQMHGAEEFKNLIKKWDRLSSNISKIPADLPILLPDVILEASSGSGVTYLLQKLADYLSEKVNKLAGSGAEIIALTAATMHIVFEEIENNTNISLVSIPKTVCNEVIKKGYKKIGLLGTIFTMEQDYMKKDLLQAGIDVIVPDKADRELVAKRIYEELELGIVKESTLQEFSEIINKMQKMHEIEAIVLGCTELPLILNNGNCALPCLDSVAIHIKELIELVQP